MVDQQKTEAERNQKPDDLPKQLAENEPWPMVKPIDDTDLDRSQDRAKTAAYLGRETACDLLRVFFAPLAQKGASLESVAAKMGYTPDHLYNQHERISWRAFHTFMNYVAQFLNPEEIRAVGQKTLQSPLARPFTVTARLLYDARDFYYWGIEHLVPERHSCIQGVVHEVGPNQLTAVFTLQPGYKPFESMFHHLHGVLIAVPTVLGLQAATVEMEMTAVGARFHIQYPSGGGILAWLRKAISWPFTARLAARELRQAHEALYHHYFRLVEETAARRRLEVAQQQQAERYANELERRVHERTAELEASNQELEDLIYTLSHDLRAPVRHITGFVKLLLENELEQLEPESANHLHVINMASQRLGRMIDDLLTFSRLNRRPLRVRPVELATVVANVQSKITSKLKQRQIIWEIGRLPVVSGDPSLLEIAWTHLVNNSVKFTASRAEATIEIGMDPSDSEPAVGVHEVVLFVRDNGVGFDQQYAHKLFRVFQRLHHENEFGGTGIGLAIVSRIIQRHGGKIWARGEIDHGATFYFTLPKPTGDQNGSKTDFVG